MDFLWSIFPIFLGYDHYFSKANENDLCTLRYKFEMIFGSSQNVLISGRTVYQFMPEKLKRFTLRKSGRMLSCHKEEIMSENLITK